MGTIFLEKRFSPLDILVKNFFNAEQEEFQQPNNRILNHPVDIYEDKEGLHFDIACTGLTKKQIELKVEDDVLRVIYTKKDDDDEKDLHIYHSGIAKRSFNNPSFIEASISDKINRLAIFHPKLKFRLAIPE